MTRADNSAHLRRAAEQRQKAALERARAALRSLDAARQPISFASVARQARVSRNWLYRQPELRVAILSCRSRPRSGPRLPSAERAGRDSLKERLDAARGELARLRAENDGLRDQVARLLGERRARG